METAAIHIDRDQRVAVFVDVENILGWLKRGGCGELLSKAKELGIVSVRRAFGDFSNPTVASRQVELQRHGFDLVHTLHPAKGKSNSADISMTIDVMECCRGPEIQWVVLATGDSDFGPVFRRLRELGKGVVGVGPSSVLSTSVSLSCHDFIFTDNHAGSHKKKGRAKGGGGGGGGGLHGEHHQHHRQHYGKSPARGAIVSTRDATPPQCFLSSRGAFRIKHQGSVTPNGLASDLADVSLEDQGNRKPRTPTKSPLLLGAPAPSSTPSPPPPPPPPPAMPAEGPASHVGKDLFSSGLAADGSAPTTTNVERWTAVALEEEITKQKPPEKLPTLAPGQLLVPGMLSQRATPPTDGVSISAGSASVSTSSTPHGSLPRDSNGCSAIKPNGDGSLVADDNRAGIGDDNTYPSASRKTRATASGCHGASKGVAAAAATTGGASGGLGALSVVRPSEKMYRYLLALDSTATGGVSSSDWGNGLSEVTLAQGLVSLAKACGGGKQDSTHCRAVEALAASSSKADSLANENVRGNTVGASGVCGDQHVYSTEAAAAATTTEGFPREEARRVAGLLQRCGFLTWISEEQQWLVTVPADVEMLRRRRDDIMIEELRTRCQEASLPFEPNLAAGLRWAHNSG